MATTIENLIEFEWSKDDEFDARLPLINTELKSAYKTGWAGRPQLPPTIALFDTISNISDVKSNFILKQLNALYKNTDVAVADVYTANANSLVDAVQKKIESNLINVLAASAVAGEDKKGASASLVRKTRTDINEEISKRALTSNITSVEGMSTDLMASQKLVNDVKIEINKEIELINTQESLYSNSTDILFKDDANSSIFIKNNANSLKIKVNTVVKFSNKVFNLSNKTINMTTKEIGNDYIVVLNTSGILSIHIDKFESPYVLKNTEIILGGFHYSLVPENETIASGQFSTSGNGMHWTQNDVDKIKGINEFSLWDIRFRAGGVISSPTSVRYGKLSNHGMVYDSCNNKWYGIFHVSTDVDKFGVSKYNTDIASGTILPIIPSAFNGNGTLKYGNLNWWTANELVQSQGASLLYEREFNSRAFGTTENKVAGGGAVTYPKTERIIGLTSRFGCEQVTGVQYYWGLDTGGGSTTGWKDTEGRGQTYGAISKILFGGARDTAAVAVGSRCVPWDSVSSNSVWSVGAVASRDSLIL